jgi:uncharacterized membrane protein YhaH (DUF805 family)
MEYLNVLFTGRLNRRTYLVGGFLVGVVYYIILYIIGLLGHNALTSLLTLVVVLLVIVVGFSMSAKRWHDLGQSGWLSLLLLIPLVNFFVWLYLVFAPGKSGSNAYGPQPKDAFEFQKVYQYK